MTVKHVLKNPKTGRLSFRRAYPPELRQFIPAHGDAGTPREYNVSLGAASLTAPGVLARYEKALADYDTVVATAHRRERRAYDMLDAPTIAYLGKLFEVGIHEEDEASVLRGQSGWADHQKRSSTA